MRKSSKILWRLTWFIFILAILYVTLSPFRFHPDLTFIRAKAHHIDWFPISAPAGYRVDWEDVITNIILFMPFGFLGYWSVGTPTRKKRIILVVMGFLFSFGIETLQLLTATRATQLEDVLTNTLGGALGVLLATLAGLG